MQKYDYQRKRKTALPEYISVISSNKCAKIKIEDIEVIEQEGRKVHVITAAKDYSFYGCLNTLANSLAERAFYRPIKGLIINFDHMKDISGSTITFNSGQCVSMGKNSISKTRSAFKKYLMNYPPYSLWERPGNQAMSVAEVRIDEEKDNIFNKKHGNNM